MQKGLGSRTRICKDGLERIHGSNWVELGTSINPGNLWKIMIRHVLGICGYIPNYPLSSRKSHDFPMIMRICDLDRACQGFNVSVSLMSAGLEYPRWLPPSHA